MGEVFDALQVLNRTMKLGLSGNALMAAEMAFKLELARGLARNPEDARLIEGKNVPSDPVALQEDYEVLVTLRQRSRKRALSDLSKYATKAMEEPAPASEEKAFKDSDHAIKRLSAT
jgi:hypothetical protein